MLRITRLLAAATATAALALLVAGSAAASTSRAVLDPALSSLDGAPLSGTIDVALGDGPPTGNRSFDVVDLEVTGAGLSVALDGRFANPGLGVVGGDGSFLIPALFVVVDGLGDAIELTLIDVAGTWGPSKDCAGPLCLETAFQIDTGGPEGVLDVNIVAVVPEPGTALLMGLGLAAVGASRRRVASGGRSASDCRSARAADLDRGSSTTHTARGRRDERSAR